MIETSEAVLDFWFGRAPITEASLSACATRWFGRDSTFDDTIRTRFAELPERAAAGELNAWHEKARPCVARVIVLDQFPRNLYRGTGQAFAYDGLAYAAACDALDRGFDAAVHPVEATFLYLPLEHAEDAAAQARCVSLFQRLLARCTPDLEPQFESFLSYAERHQQVVERFGRFPHRNEALGRPSTDEEVAHLAAGGEAF